MPFSKAGNCICNSTSIKKETQGIADAEILSKWQSAGVTVGQAASLDPCAPHSPIYDRSAVSMKHVWTSCLIHFVNTHCNFNRCSPLLYCHILNKNTAAVISQKLNCILRNAFEHALLPVKWVIATNFQVITDFEILPDIKCPKAKCWKCGVTDKHFKQFSSL